VSGFRRGAQGQIGCLEGLVMINIAAGRWAISLEEAKAAVAGYAFATRPADDHGEAPKWGYKTYDCVPASQGPEFSDLDIFVAAGLNAQLNVSAVGALQVAVRGVGKDLAQAASHQREFADLSMEELSDDPPRESTGSLIARAYLLMKGTKYVGLARAHKVLHHKQPMLVPLLDNITAKVYRDGRGKRLRSEWNLWQHVRDEVANSRVEFDELREWFAGEANARGCVPLGLPRLHDILLWLHATDQWTDAVAEGSSL
jgi:hypothetical protein